ncbi:MAG: DUF664 domain-containing protein [Rubricoccaceae bacterium]|nr:DUF664 domain-containing protein [Rubricoccaceae bacterium]
MDLARAFLDQSRAFLRGDFLPKIEAALDRMSEEDLWWRPNDASNSAGNLALHLAGNVRQWLVHGLGGAPDVRDRPAEFAATGGLGKAEVLARLRGAVDDGCAVLARADADALAASYTLQGNPVTGLYAVYHVVEHFAMHTGQIVWLAKARASADLGFYETHDDGRARLRWTPTPEGPRPTG